jgi:gamma-glutamyltranspeptidase/glutathione hydrolase
MGHNAGSVRNHALFDQLSLTRSTPMSLYDFQSRRSVVRCTGGMVATSQPLAALAGLDALRAGGDAVDAAVTTAAVLNVVEPIMTGIGGDMFALVWRADERKLYALNGSGRAPAAATLEAYYGRGLSKTDSIPFSGPLAITVPGALHGWQTLLDRWGKHSLADALAPAIRHAYDGYPVSELIAAGWALNAPLMRQFPANARTYLINDNPPQVGEIMRIPALGQSFEKIASEGIYVFYHGEIGQAIADAVEADGGFLTLADLAAHTSTWVEPIHTAYRGHQVYECPPNGQGLAALIALNIVANFNVGGLGAVDATHVLIEAMKLAFADAHRYIADPEKADVPVQGLLSREYATERSTLIDMEQALEPTSGMPPAGEDTVYLTVVDDERNAVSLINSNYTGIGCGVVAGKTGIALQSRGAGFSLDPDHPNCLAPGKRPYHTIIPAMIFREGMPVYSFGVMGGSMQPQGHLQVAVNLLDQEMDPQRALDAPRFRVIEGRRVSMEPSTPQGVVQELRRRGHEIAPPGSYGGGQIIEIDPETGALAGGSDPRKDGCAIGY